jgi:two-component system CheB/CheR fusion protein
MNPHREPLPGEAPDAAAVNLDAGPGVAAQARGPGSRVLVVDDEQFAREAMALLLQQQGYQVCVACSGPEALELAQAFEPDVVLLDIAMAGMDGFETALRLRTAAPGPARPRLVAVSGYGGERFAMACRQAGFDHCLTKPVARANLIGLLEELR